MTVFDANSWTNWTEAKHTCSSEFHVKINCKHLQTYYGCLCMYSYKSLTVLSISDVNLGVEPRFMRVLSIFNFVYLLRSPKSKINKTDLNSLS